MRNYRRGLRLGVDGSGGRRRRRRNPALYFVRLQNARRKRNFFDKDFTINLM